jgi:hypothetical protein
MDSMLKDLFGGDDDERRPQAQAQARDFVSRFDQGAIDEGYSDTEAWEQFQRVSQKVDPATIERAAEKAFARMDPQQRAQVAQYLQQQGGQFTSGVSATDDPRQMAGMVSRIQREAPGGLSGLFGGGGSTAASSGGGGIGEAIGNLFGGGGGDNDQQLHQTTQEGGGFPGGTLGKVALGGIAAFALKEILGGRDDEEHQDTRAATRPKRSV